MDSRSEQRAGPARVLLVAGPSGSGKSTFIRLLTSKASLQPELEAALPAGVRTWRKVTRRDVRRVRVDRDVPGMIQHYGITLCDFAADPALSFFRNAQDATIVTIWAEPKSIVRQRQLRQVRESSKKTLPSTIWRRLFRAPLQGLRKLTGKCGVWDKRSLYLMPGWLDDSYSRWDAFVRTQVAEKGRTAIDVVPSADPAARPDFVIGRRPPRNASGS